VLWEPKGVERSRKRKNRMKRLRKSVEKKKESTKEYQSIRPCREKKKAPIKNALYKKGKGIGTEGLGEKKGPQRFAPETRKTPV